MPRPLVCPLCGTDDTVTVLETIDDETDQPQLVITCRRHQPPYEHTIDDPDAPGGPASGSSNRREGTLVHELGLYDKLTEIVEGFDQPVEYGVIEHLFAHAHPDDYRRLHREFGQVKIDGSRRYSVTSYLSRLLGNLTRQNRVRHHDADGTGFWTHVSAWSPTKAPPGGDILSWQAYAEDHDIDPETWPARGIINEAIPSDDNDR